MTSPIIFVLAALLFITVVGLIFQHIDNRQLRIDLKQAVKAYRDSYQRTEEALALLERMRSHYRTLGLKLWLAAEETLIECIDQARRRQERPEVILTAAYQVLSRQTAAAHVELLLNEAEEELSKPPEEK